MNFEEKEILNQRLEPASGVLYVVGTPIGNLGDLSPRAKSLLKNVSAIACEDTRHSGQLLRGLGTTTTPLISFHTHNIQSRIPKLLALLKNGESLALISDAGLPGISDPGEELVCAARTEGLSVICIPGPCAATTALVTSGLPSNRFCFEGFLPSKAKDRKQRLSMIVYEQRTTIIYEAPHRLLKLLHELIELCGEGRPLLVARELTKRYEEQIGPNIGAVIKHFMKNKPKGECTLVLGGATSIENEQLSSSELIDKMQMLIKNGASSNEAARKLAEETVHSKRFLYNLLHKTAQPDSP